MAQKFSKSRLPADPVKRKAVLQQARTGELDPSRALILLILSKGFVTVYQAAEDLGVDARRVEQWINDGKLEAIRWNRGRYVLKQSIGWWRKQRKAEGLAFEQAHPSVAPPLRPASEPEEDEILWWPETTDASEPLDEFDSE